MTNLTTPEKRNLEGGCHCGAVRYSASVDLGRAFRCNCSICSRTAATAAPCEPSAFELRSGQAQLHEYRFGQGRLTRFFCSHCGIHCFARSSGPNGETMAVNVNTLEGVELGELRVVYFDGRHDTFEPRNEPAPILRSAAPTLP
jgi:hypothetical protein